MKHHYRGALAIAVVALGGLATQLPASASAYDTTPPTLTTPLKASFVVGTQLDQTDFGGGLFFYNVPERISWSGSDASGTPTYTLWDYYYGENPSKQIAFTEKTTARVTGSDYIDQEGGGSQQISNWSVQAKDIYGNSTEKAVYGTPLVVTQDNGYQTPGYETTDVSIAYHGSWSTSHCGCFAEGTTHSSSAAGDAAVITVNVPASQGVRKVALVMETAPDRGKAKVYVDGTQNKTIDTFASSATHQVVVWQGSLATGSHTIRLVNQSTAGRSRIDLDAVVVN